MEQARNVFLIVGCQRSGSTLLESIFNAHPLVHVIGEENNAAYECFFDPSKLADVSGEWICLRIPGATHLLQHAVEQFAGAGVLFTLRDPRDVVASMCKLDYGSENWLTLFGHNEIRRTVSSLPGDERWKERLAQLYDEGADPGDVRFGGFCWAAKNRFIPLYSDSSLSTEVVRYEQLTTEPECYLRRICEHLRLDWSDSLLEHHEHSSGEWAGTDKGEPIHRRSLGSYKAELTMEDRRKLHSLIGSEMEMHGYVERFD